MTDNLSTNQTRARREEEKEERRQTILDAAEQLFASKGWEQTNYGDIAKCTRLSRSLIYFYFPDKEQMFDALCIRSVKSLSTRFQKVIQTPLNGLEQVIELGRAYCVFHEEERTHFEILAINEAQRSAQSNNPLFEESKKSGQACLNLIIQALEKGISDGSIRSDIGNIQATGVMMWAFTHGLIQVAVRKASILEEKLQINPQSVAEHGFQMIRIMLQSCPQRHQSIL
jgi:AcrR family transcriptional regulator